MGAGRGVDIPLICKIIALIFCAAAVGLNVSGTAPMSLSGTGRLYTVSNSLVFSTGGFIIVIAIFLGWTIFKDEVDKLFAGCMVVCGAVWTIGAGLGVVLFYIDYSEMTDTLQLVGGILTLAAGVVMIVDALRCFGVI